MNPPAIKTVPSDSKVAVWFARAALICPVAIVVKDVSRPGRGGRFRTIAAVTVSGATENAAAELGWALTVSALTAIAVVLLEDEIWGIPPHACNTRVVEATRSTRYFLGRVGAVSFERFRLIALPQ